MPPQLTGNAPKLIDHVKSSSEDKSGSQLTTAVGGFHLGLGEYLVRKLAKCRATVATSKDTVDKAVLFLFCSWRWSVSVAEALEEAK